MTASEKSKQTLLALSQLSKTSNLSINELRVLLALERIVARVEAHKILRDRLIFKGGFVLLKVLKSERFTRDIDALAEGVPKEEVLELVKEALRLDLNDGIYLANPEIEDLLDQGPYGGYRIKVPFQIGELPTEPRKLKKLSRVHLDIGFGDVIFGRAKSSQLSPLLLGQQPISWRVYPLESIFAEKLETLVSRGSGNSRAKDLFDLVAIFDEIESNSSLKSAIQKTFKNRETVIPDSLMAFFEQLEFAILERSWGSVELAGGKMTFLECKGRLIGVMKKLDVIFS